MKEGMKTAGDIMEPITATLSPSDSVAEAVRRMRAAPRKVAEGSGVKGMLVLNEDGSLAGMVSVKDILRAIVPGYMGLSDVGSLAWPSMLAEMARKVRDKSVSEIMSTNIVSVSPDTTLMECAELVVQKDFWRLPVVDADGKLLGMVYARDLHYAIADALLGNEEEGGQQNA